MINSLAKIFDNLELSWIDSSKEILNSKEYRDLLLNFPNLQRIFQEGKNEDELEFRRTIKHVFRVFKIFFLIIEGKYFHDTLSSVSIKHIRAKVKSFNQNAQNELIIPLILMYHDIGRFFDKKNHPRQSYLLISNKKLLEPFDLLDIEKLLISKIIQYHLLFATIYTGESTFLGIYSLLKDVEFIRLISYKKYGAIFVDLLEIFTYIDILGYSYAKIYDHYSKYFDEINYKLKNLLRIWLKEGQKTTLEKALEYSKNWIEWRIAGALRIFQFVETKPYLTKKFYFIKLKESLGKTSNKLIDGLNWETIKKNYLIHSCKIQIKYGLPFLMILAFGDFYRSRMTKDIKISCELILFWTLLSKEIASRSEGDNFFIWNVFLIGFPNWYELNKKMIKKLEINSIELIIKNSSHEFDEERKEFNLYLDFKQLFNDVN